MKPISLLLLLSILSFLSCYSQNAHINSGQAGVNNTQTLTSKNIMNGSVRTFDNRYEGVEGSPYFSDIFSYGTIWMKNGEAKENVVMVFNLSTNQLETQLNGALTKIPIRMVHSFEIKDSLGVPHLFVVRVLANEKGESKPMALESLYEGKSQFYRRYYKEFREADYEGAYSADQRTDQYIDRQKYYVQAAGEATFRSVRLSRSSWQKVLSSQKSAIKMYLKKEDLKMQEVADAIQLLRYFDSLIKN